MIRIFIADDHAMVRGGLKQIVALESDMCVVGEAADADSLLAGIGQTACDVLLLDLRMPGAVGVELLKQVRQRSPALPILVLSMHSEGQFVSQAIKAGAAGFVTKGSEPEVLIAALRKVMAGGRYIDPLLVETMVFDLSGELSEPHARLSRRELQILSLIVCGETLSGIAEDLHLSPKTISTYKMRLMEKLGVRNNADLIRYAIRHDLLAH